MEFYVLRSTSLVLLDLFAKSFNLFSFLFFISVEEILVREKIWTLVSQNEPSLVPISMVITLPTFVISITGFTLHI